MEIYKEDNNFYNDRDTMPVFSERDICVLRLYIKDIPFEVLQEGEFSNYDEFATIIQNRIKQEIAELQNTLK